VARQHITTTNIRSTNHLYTDNIVSIIFPRGDKGVSDGGGRLIRSWGINSPLEGGDIGTDPVGTSTNKGIT
jgi:hypothetical protein